MSTLTRNLLFALLALFFLVDNGMAQSTDDSAYKQILPLVTEARTTQYFSDESVPADVMTAILEAGSAAMSGMNMQPWYFGAVINQDIIEEITSNMSMGGPPAGGTGTPPAGAPAGADGASMPAWTPSAYPKAGLSDAPAFVAVACTENNEFVTGMACENMVITARSLGYGAKVVGGGVDQLNEDENKMILEIPDNMNVVAILIVGKPDTTIDYSADGVTGASTRKPLDEVSIIIQ